MRELTDPTLDYDAIAKRALEQAERESEIMWPPDRLQERRQHKDAAYIKFYRQMTRGRP